ncbi:MAG: YIP1 family protein [Candidatus Aenigmarchaeota archaeon]|nr:YIP1 family protein [Candidatus Aenigmarchaeota archaeon]
MAFVLLSRAIKFLRQPSKAMGKERNSPPMQALHYLLAMLILYSVLRAMADAFFVLLVPDIDIVRFLIFMPPLHFLKALTATAANVLFFHSMAYVLGAKEPVGQSFKVVVYGLTPFWLLGWTPLIELGFIGLVFTVWTGYLMVKGAEKLLNLSPRKAILTWILSLFLLHMSLQLIEPYWPTPSPLYLTAP